MYQRTEPDFPVALAQGPYAHGEVEWACCAGYVVVLIEISPAVGWLPHEHRCTGAG